MTEFLLRLCFSFVYALYYTYCDIIFAAFVPPLSLENLEEIAKTIPTESQGKFIFFFTLEVQCAEVILMLLCFHSIRAAATC